MALAKEYSGKEENSAGSVNHQWEKFDPITDIAEELPLFEEETPRMSSTQKGSDQHCSATGCKLI